MTPSERLSLAIHQESAAIAPQTSELIEAAKEALRENERLRHALVTIRDDLSSVTVTGEEIHCIVGCIGDVLDQQLIPQKE